MARNAAGLREVVAVGAGDRDVAGHVRSTGSARRYIAKFTCLHTRGVENASVGEGSGGDLVTGVCVALYARLIAAVSVVIEAGNGAFDRAIMAGDATAVGHVTDCSRELRVGGEMVVDFLERHELVADLGFEARIHVARHAIDACMGTLVPGDVVRIHLVT